MHCVDCVPQRSFDIFQNINEYFYYWDFKVISYVKVEEQTSMDENILSNHESDTNSPNNSTKDIGVIDNFYCEYL